MIFDFRSIYGVGSRELNIGFPIVLRHGRDF
jgi:hypothetical protein